MRTTLSFAAVLVLGTGAVQAQQPVAAPAAPAAPLVSPYAPRTAMGFIDLNLTATHVTGDEARFLRYRDVRDQPGAEGFRFDRIGDGWRFQSNGRNIGLRDQYLSAAIRTSRLKGSFSWDQIPEYLSADTRTPYVASSPGVWRLDDGAQSGLESGQLRLSDLVSGATPFELRSRRHIAAFNLLFQATRALDLKVSLRQTDRRGVQPFMGGFAFNNVVEVAAPVDTRTRDVKADAEWATTRGMVRVGYDGSWFANDVPTLIWDNPLKLTDAVSATGYVDGRAGAQGRAAMWPNSTDHGVSTAASIKLPGKSRAIATVRVGALRQDAPLEAATINSAAPPIPLPRATADIQARTVAMNYTFTSRPAARLWINARYRYYDFDNRTPEFTVPQFLVMDQTLHAGVTTSYVSHRRQTLEADASVNATKATAIRVGYTRGSDDRSFRIFERTTEDAYRASVDSLWRSVTLRAIVERSERRGSGFDAHQLVEAGEQPAMRHYDVADRSRDRVTGFVQVFPHKMVGISGSASLGRDDYTNSGFGLRDNRNQVYTAGVELTPSPKVAVSTIYSNERYTSLQHSRSAAPGPQVLDPTRDWSTDATDRVHTVSANLDLLKLVPRTEVRLVYDFSRSHAAYVYLVPADSTLAALQQLPTVRHETQVATADVRYYLTRAVAVGAFVWHDDYRVDDFAFREGNVGGLVTTGSLFLGSVYRPYTATAASLRLICTW